MARLVLSNQSTSNPLEDTPRAELPAARCPRAYDRKGDRSQVPANRRPRLSNAPGECRARPVDAYAPLTVGHVHVPRDRRTLVAAVDDEIVALGLARDRFLDRGLDQLVGFGGAQRRAQVGGVLLAEAHIERAGAVSRTRLQLPINPPELPCCRACPLFNRRAQPCYGEAI